MSSTMNANATRPAPLVIPAKIDLTEHSVKQTTMSAINTIKQTTALLSIAEIDNIDELVLLLKEKKRTLKVERTNLQHAEKAAERAIEKARRDAEKEVEKAAEKAAREVQRAALKTAKEAEKAAEKAAKDAVKAAEKATKDAEKAAEKAKDKLANDGLREIKKQVALDAGVLPKPKNIHYLNFNHWSKENGPSAEALEAAGGRQTWLKTEWSKLTKSEKEALDAPWNAGNAGA